MPKLSSNAYEIVNKRYFNKSETSWEQLSYRVGGAVASNEIDQQKYKELFSQEIFDMNFIPGGRILRNAGKIKQSMLNCGTLPIFDNIEDIGEAIKNALVMWKYGAGIGINFSPLRERGRLLVSMEGEASGLISFLDVFESAANVIETGGQRRSGCLALVMVSHPEIFNFIDVKQKDGKLERFNLSVGITDDFINAVNEDANWDLTFAGQTVRTVRARELWDKILEGMINKAEPGLINMSNLTKNNSYYFQPIIATNLCITGDTKISVADDRETVNIKTLAENDEDVDVYCTNDKGEVVIRKMRNIRKTGEKQKVYKVTFDDGSSFKGTKNHKIKMLDGSEKAIENLNVGDRISHLTRYQLTNKRSKNKTPYWFWNRGSAFQKSEHRIVYEHYNGKIKSNTIIHHKDFNSLNNSFDNLIQIDKDIHTLLHSEINSVGENNGRYKGMNSSEVFSKAIDLSKFYNRRVTKEEWFLFCKESDISVSNYSLGKFKSYNNMLEAAAMKAKVYCYKTSSECREYKRYEKLLEKTDLDIIFDNGSINVIKTCECCNKDFIVKWKNRNQCFCSVSCSNKSLEKRNVSVYGKLNKQDKTKEKQVQIFLNLKNKLNRDPLKKEWENACKINSIPYRIATNKLQDTSMFKSYGDLKEASGAINYKIISVEYCGEEDVYNGTVDDFHNYMIVVNDSKTKQKLINSMNCGEIPLPAYGMCCLGSLVLPNFVSQGGNTNWKKLEESTRLSIRFLDNILDINHYPLKKSELACKEARRIGLGVMGLHSYLMSKKIRYGSEKSISEIEKLYKFLRDVSYSESISLAVEKGAFPKFSRNEYCKASYIRKLPASLRMDIRDKGIRNVCLLSGQPTGTTSLIPEVTSAIEPLIYTAYKRKDRVSERIYIDKYLVDIIKEGATEKPDWLVDIDDLKAEDHLEIQAVVNKFMDNAVSKTINFPKDTSVDTLSKLLLEYISDLKGCTVYVDGSREGQIYEKISFEEAKRLVESGEYETNQSECDVQCVTGSCEL